MRYSKVIQKTCATLLDFRKNCQLERDRRPLIVAVVTSLSYPLFDTLGRDLSVLVLRGGTFHWANFCRRERN